MPSLAALTLVRVLAASGCRLRVPADIDEAGFVVADQIRSAAPDSTGWRHVWQPVRDPLHEKALLDLLLADLALDPARDGPDDAS